MKFEFEKLLRQRKLIAVVVAVLAAVYVFLAFGGNDDTFSGFSKSYFWENEEYRQRVMSEKSERVDEAWIADMKAEYKAFVDENMLSANEIAEKLEWEKENGIYVDYTAEDVLANPYNIDYAYDLLTDEAFYSYDMENIYTTAFKVYIPLAEDAVAYLHESYERSNYYCEKENGISYAETMGYSEAQLNDYWEFVDARYDGFELTVGYSRGWDILCTLMQYLPFTLGPALIVVLGNLFSQERSYGMVPILRTAKNGRTKLLRRKITAALCIAAGLWLIFQLAMLIAMALTYTLRGGDCTAMSFDCKPSIYGFTWLGYYALQCLFSFFGTLVFAIFVCCMSSVMGLRFSMPLNLAITLLCGIPIDRFCYADKAFSLLDKLRAVTPPQLMAAYPNLQVYQSYEFGGIIVQLAYVMAAATVIEAVLMLIYLKRRDG